MRKPSPSRRSAAAGRTLAAATLVVAGLLPLAVAPAHASAPPVGVRAAADGDDHDFPSGGLSPELRAKLDQAVQQVLQEAGIPGAQVGIWLPGKGSYIRAFGVADKATGAPMTDNLNMRIGSETKTFTATAVLELVDDGLVGLDDPISKYIDGVPNGDCIKLRDLLDMRSGLFSYSADDDFVHALLSDPNHVFTPQELLAYGYKHDNVFEPGTQFQYSNSNYILLGLVIEKMTGRSVRDVIHQRVTEPSHLERTIFPVGPELPRPYAHGYTNQTLSGQIEDSTHWNPSWAWSAGAMISDLHDLKHWAKDLATGTLLSPATQAERLNVLPTGIPGAGYGLGIFNIQGWIGHNGSLPGYESLTIYLPEEHATVVALLNTDVFYQGNEPSTVLGKAITSIITPNHIYDIPVEK
ncbi:D-alanyl-D-alanine carboxypeptidase [Kitasatospora sp. MAA4]|uniref:serine hydrolase domain-containing protein n=1 Tax=Kitasatospora sp. MAA4 TaxID=3035093 RepID=UPI002473CC34|nr:serine hydrolase domain-containing protein [Kitasatospora sp. MAA4]MDH6130770.1 D-alanyl-D-alanine carboxypeptidase [Kitasatospora sp. MAA4]